METLHWRKNAKWVAYVDLVLSCLNLLVVLLIAILAGEFSSEIVLSAPTTVTSTNSSDVESKEITTPVDGDDNDDVSTTTVVLIWLGVAILTVVTFVQGWATLELLSATEVKEGKVIEALKKCGIWRNVQIIAVLIQCADYMIMGYYIPFIILLLIRGMFFYVVYQFMEELDNLLHPVIGPVAFSSGNPSEITRR